MGRTRGARARRRGDRGAALVEFAITAPFLFIVLFGIIDFGQVYFEQLTMRNDTEASARLAAVASFGTNTTCPTTPSSGTFTGNTLALVCQTKNAIQINDKANIRVKFVSTPSFAKGNQLLICTQYPASSVTGFYAPLLNDKILQAKSTVRVEQNGTLADGEETSPSGGSWTFCV